MYICSVVVIYNTISGLRPSFFDIENLDNYATKGVILVLNPCRFQHRECADSVSGVVDGRLELCLSKLG